MRARSLAASLIAATALALTPAIPAGASNPAAPTLNGQPCTACTTAADDLRCWTRQAPEWTPGTLDTDPLRTWAATRTRQQAGGVWEVAVGTDIGSEPTCVQVLPGIWVSQPDLPNVKAYLKSVDLAVRGVVEIAGDEVPAALDLYDWQRLADCESGGQWGIVDATGRFHGGLQLTIPGAERLSVDGQIRLARKKLDAEGPTAWPVCSKRIGWA